VQFCSTLEHKHANFIGGPLSRRGLTAFESSLLSDGAGQNRHRNTITDILFVLSIWRVLVRLNSDRDERGLKKENFITRKKITPLPWFDIEAKEAAKFYVGVFPNTHVCKVVGYGAAGPGPPG